MELKPVWWLMISYWSVSVWHHGTCWLIWSGDSQICSVITNQVGDLCHSWSWMCGVLVSQRSSASSLRVHSVRVNNDGRKRAVHPAGSCETHPVTGRGRISGTVTVELCASTWRKSFEETKSGNNYKESEFSHACSPHTTPRENTSELPEGFESERTRLQYLSTETVCHSVSLCVWNKLDIFYI